MIGSSGGVSVYNETRETFVATKAAVADSYVTTTGWPPWEDEAVGAAWQWTMDRAHPRRAYHRDDVPDRFDFSEQGEAGGAHRGILASLPYLKSVPQSRQRSRAASGRNQSLADTSWRPPED